MDKDINIKSTKESNYAQKNLFTRHKTYSVDSYPVHNKKRCTESKEKPTSSNSICALLQSAEQRYLGSLESQMTEVNNVESIKLCGRNISNNRKGRCRDTNLCTSSLEKRRQDMHQKEQQSVKNVKAQINKIVNDVEIMLATYTSQIGRLKLKYLETDAFMMQDIEDIMFIFNCVLSNLMKELTEKQHYLTDYCVPWNNMQKHDDIRPEFLHHHCSDSNNLHSENDDCPESSRCAEIDSANTHKRQSYKEMQELEMESGSDNGTIPVHPHVSNDKSGSLSAEAIEITGHDHQRNHNDELQSDKYVEEKNKAALPSVDKISKRILTRSHSMSNGTVESEAAANILSNAELSDQNATDKLRKQHQEVSDSPKSAQTIEQLNDDSDLCSTCSTILLQPVIPVAVDNNKLKDTTKKEEMPPRTASTSAVLIELSDTDGESRSSCSSDETYFSPHYKTSASSKQDAMKLMKQESETHSRPVIRTRRFLRKNENPLKKRKFKSVREAVTLQRKHYFGADYDKNTKYSKEESYSKKDLSKKRGRKATEKQLLDCEIVLERMDKYYKHL